MIKLIVRFAVCFLICTRNGPQLFAADGGAPPTPVAVSSPTGRGPEHVSDSAAALAAALGITFVDNSSSTVVVERAGKRYIVDLAARTIAEVQPPSSPSASNLRPVGTPSPRPQQIAKTQAPRKEKPKVYEPGDDSVFSLPTGRRLDRSGLYVNFSHRFAFDTAFTGKARGHDLLGLDGFSVSSFGFRFGVTDKFSVSAYRSPSAIGRPIQLMATYNFLDEHDKQPFNAAVRFSVEGQNDFSKNFTANFEGIFSRSLTRRAQVYVVPTVSLHNRPLVSPTDQPPDQRCENTSALGVGGALDIHPCANTFSLGVAGSLDIRPTVALIAEVNPTIAGGRALGVHRPAYAFGIQKKIWRHAFTLGFTNSPGTTVSQRSGTRAEFLNDPSADTPSGLFIGFDLTRQIY